MFMSSRSSMSTPSASSTPALHSTSGGINAGEIAAICIACVSLIVLSFIIWLVRKKRAAKQDAAVGVGGPGPEDGVSASPPGPPMPDVRVSAASSAHGNARTASTVIPEYMAEKRDTISGYSDSGETASSPGSSTALSSFPLLNQGPVTLTDAEPNSAQMRSFRLAWDDPPPTPELRRTSMRSSQFSDGRRSHGGDGFLIATSGSCDPPRTSVYVAYLAEGRSQTTLGQPPEYSRY
ncbi:hypothetical protein C2E23DRAFT_432087 [Lenzites betulinus]|nr:hypothetical protein C2E23DRAFT_432087 [Lenzites betulinus]